MLNPRSIPLSPSRLIEINGQIANSLTNKQLDSTNVTNILSIPEIDTKYLATELCKRNSLKQKILQPKLNVVKESSCFACVKGESEAEPNEFLRKYIFHIIGGTVLVAAILIYIHHQEEKNKIA